MIASTTPYRPWNSYLTLSLIGGDYGRGPTDSLHVIVLKLANNSLYSKWGDWRTSPSQQLPRDLEILVVSYNSIHGKSSKECVASFFYTSQTFIGVVVLCVQALCVISDTLVSVPH